MRKAAGADDHTISHKGRGHTKRTALVRGAALLFVTITYGLTIAQEQDAAAAPPVQDDVEMVAIPAGEFIMGSDDPEADDNEKPATKVFVDAFSIDKFEVTNARYLRCIEAGTCTRPPNRGYDDSTTINLPVTIVSWQQAMAYCRWVGKRLPTEAEWEKAARGTDGRRYPWGDTLEAERANFGYSVGSTTAVGSYPKGASPYGVMDMAGNVWEWTSSLYTPYPYDPHDGREDLNARGSRVERSGSWYHPPWHVRTTRRTAIGHVYRRINDLGFRCAR